MMNFVFKMMDFADAAFILELFPQVCWLHLPFNSTLLSSALTPFYSLWLRFCSIFAPSSLLRFCSVVQLKEPELPPELHGRCYCGGVLRIALEMANFLLNFH